MIKVNLLPVKRKKKAKPVPAFLLSAIGVFILAGAVNAYLVYFFNSRVDERKATVAKNDAKIKELQDKIKAADEFEKKNKAVQQQNDVIEQLTKNRSVPVKVLDGVSSQLPIGVWLTGLEVKGMDITLSCMGFSNTEVVNYVNNLKNSPIFTEVFLLESVLDQVAGVSVYKFKIKCMVKT